MRGPSVSCRTDVWCDFHDILQSLRNDRLNTDRVRYVSAVEDRMDRRAAASFVIAAQPFFGSVAVAGV